MRYKELLKEYIDTSTPAFQAWFGDSKIVNRDGTPEVVYHGTTHGSKTFFGGGTHFGTSRAASDRIDDLMGISPDYEPPHDIEKMTPHIYPVYLRMENPLELPDYGEWWSDELWAYLAKKGTVSGTWEENRDSDHQHIFGWLDEHTKYDGVVYENSHEHAGFLSYIIFDEDQVRGAL